MCSPLGDGAAAALIVSDEFARSKGLKGPRVDASVLVSGRGDNRSMAPAIRRAAAQAYEMAGIGPEDIDLAEIHDAVAPAERSEEHTSELQSHSDLVCRLLLEKKKKMSCARRVTHAAEQQTH